MSDLRNISAVILAGGKGTRLQSVVSDRPKVLATVLNRPFLAYLLDQIVETGIKHTILCVGYCAEQVRGAFGEEYSEMRLSYSYETTLLGTGGALRQALSLVASKMMIVMNGDSFCEVNFFDLLAFHRALQARATIVLTHQPDIARYGRVSLLADGAISGFEEKGGSAGAGWVNAGIYMLDSTLVHDIPPGRVVSLEHEIFPGWVGQHLYGFQSQGRFLDIGTPESYAQADDLFPSKLKENNQ